MPECKLLVGGGLAVGLGIVCLILYWLERDKARLAASLPVSACGSLAEGIVQVAGRAVGATTLTCPVSGVPSLILSYKVEQFHPRRSKKKWEVVGRHYEAVPFHVEDSSGRVLVDPSQAEFHSQGKLEFSTQKRWGPSRRQRELLQNLGVTPDDLEARLRNLYVQLRSESLNQALAPMHDAVGRAAAFAREKAAGTEGAERQGEGLQKLDDRWRSQEKQQKTKAAEWAVAEAQSSILRYSEEILRPGDPVCVIGPAMEDSAAPGARRSIDIRKVHPSDPFLIGVGAPAEVHATIRRKARNLMLLGIALLAVGVGMLASCYS